MYPNNNDLLFDHTTMVEVVAEAGAPPPAEWLELRARFDGYISLTAQHSMLDRLTTAIIDGDTDADIAALRALATAEMLDPQVGGQAIGHIQSHVLQRLRTLYDGVAATNYETIAGIYDETVARFCEAAALVDVEGDANDLLLKPAKVREAYHAAESSANQLGRLLPALAASATLARGVDVSLANNLLMLPLACDVTGQHRRKLWQAWDHTGGRCGRWGALHRLGVQIRAHPLDEALNEYRLPAPLELRQRQVPGAPRGVVEQYQHDPEDNPAAVEPIDPVVRRTSGRMRTA